MRSLGSFFLFSMVIVAACSNDGNSTVPDIPDDPVGSKITILSRGGSEVFIDDTGNGLKLDADGRLLGDDLFFTSAKKCDGLSYVTAIPLSDWDVCSAVLKQGEGFVMGSRMLDGVTFTSMYVHAVDDATGNVTLKSKSPFYGDGVKFYLNSVSVGLYKESGSEIVVFTKPTTYNVELVSGEWASVKSHITYVQLNYSENRTGEARFDTLIFSNGAYGEKRLPIVQLQLSVNDSINSKNE